MKAKNQGLVSSDMDAKEKLIVYVYDYLKHTGANMAAATFIEEIKYNKNIEPGPADSNSFLADWWCVFWDLYIAVSNAEGKRSMAEPSGEAKAFHDYHIRSGMSPRTSPPQSHGMGIGGPPPPFMGGSGGPMPMGGPRYGPPPTHHGGPMRGGHPMGVGPPPPGSRMQGMVQPLQPPQMGAPPPHGPPPPHPPPIMGGASSPRYGPHSGHMTPGSSGSGEGPVGPQPGPSPGLANRMTPNHSGSPHPQVVGGPPAGMQQMGGPPQGQGPPPPPPQMSQGGPPPPPPQMQQRGMPSQSGGGPGGWQNNQFNVSPPADQQCFMTGPPGSSGQQGEFGQMMMNDGSGAPPNQQPPGTNQGQDEYVMPGAYGQQSDQGDANSEIMKLKESLENNTNEGDQTSFNMDFNEPQPKW